ncbi:MAG: HAMP domain-containing histidine kinase [Devosia sp.]|nr:HAMP domain-containing histidine kinase [Devosia sp.]
MKNLGPLSHIGTKAEPDTGRTRCLMDEHWTTSPNARRVLQHADDLRPAWLWSQDGQRLIWSNPASELFLAKLKKHGLKLAEPAVPIKGQVTRTIRLGSPGRTSLARIQFRAGDKPVSATCATTPLSWDGGETALLIVGVDAISHDIVGAYRAATAPVAAWEPLVEESEEAIEADVSFAAPYLPAAEEPSAQPESPFAAIADDGAYARELQNWQESDAETAYTTEASPEAIDDSAEAEPVEEADRPLFHSLSALVDRLAADDDLYAPLSEADDHPPAGSIPVVEDGPPPAQTQTLYKVTGRFFRAETRSEAAAAAEGERLDDAPASAPPGSEIVERVSRYNFDELSRILNERVGERGSGEANAQRPTPEAPVNPAPATSGALVNLGGETLVLNRLPLGILVFRDQQILFANRAITEMIGYGSVESLRQAGLGAVFPGAGENGEAGPINHLVQRDGTLVPVTARLQSMSWNGRPALMLSASSTEVRTGHEDAVRAFAQGLAELRDDGFFEASRTGMIIEANSLATATLGEGKTILGQALSSLVSEDETLALRAFLERPARFAETERPSIALHSADGKAEIQLFTQGQAGVISGYFGFVRLRASVPRQVLSAQTDFDPALLARISRGVRRPLSTVIGYADLLRTQAFGTPGSERYEAYAQDIATAGQDIAALVDELDDYTRLREGRYLPERASLDLTELLETCVLRIRAQANGARVLLRNAISETLPRVTADRASLAQAVLNLLASAIDQSPAGGAVVISAQRLDDGGIAIHVRDNSNHTLDMAERFVVYRDGQNAQGQALTPVRSSVGLALTRSLLAVNTVSLSVDPAGQSGVLFSLKVPADLVDKLAEAE